MPANNIGVVDVSLLYLLGAMVAFLGFTAYMRVENSVSPDRYCGDDWPNAIVASFFSWFYVAGLLFLAFVMIPICALIMLAAPAMTAICEWTTTIGVKRFGSAVGWTAGSVAVAAAFAGVVLFLMKAGGVWP